MDQRTHAWVAIRAVGLLEDLGAAPGLVSILKPHVKEAAIGSWIPDLQESRDGSGDIDNHVMKMKPYSGKIKERFVVKKNDLLKKLGPERKMTGFIRGRTDLGGKWWDEPYKADPHPGQHLANRAMSLCVTLADLLILGDRAVANLVPGDVSFAPKVDMDARTRKSQAATYFFMLSHFMADACMPCHCDARTLSGYSKGLHKEMEKDWAKKVGTYFMKTRLPETRDSVKTVVSKAKDVDGKFPGLDFKKTTIPSIKKGYDVWTEVMNVCRGSFAINSIIAPPDEYPYPSKKLAPFETVFSGANGKQLLEEMNATVMHDAVLNTAMAWKEVWDRFD